MKKIITLIFLLYCVCSCDTKNNSHNKSKKQKPKIEIIYETSNFKLYGYSSIDKSKILNSIIKFEPYIGFEDFKVVNTLDTKHAILDLKSNINAYNFRTLIRIKYSEKNANFAGHYTFVDWGCGSPCYNSLLIDRQTGKIYDSPDAVFGYDFRSNSRMLIVNPPDSNGFYSDFGYSKPVIYIFDEHTKKFLLRKPK